MRKDTDELMRAAVTPVCGDEAPGLLEPRASELTFLGCWLDVTQPYLMAAFLCCPV